VPHLTHPEAEQTPWDILLREVEEFVDLSERPRHMPPLIQLNQQGAKHIATALRHLSRSIDIHFRDDRLLVVPLIER
jgi:hypothetical protein